MIFLYLSLINEYVIGRSMFKKLMIVFEYWVDMVDWFKWLFMVFVKIYVNFVIMKRIMDWEDFLDD